MEDRGLNRQSKPPHAKRPTVRDLKRFIGTAGSLNSLPSVVESPNCDCDPPAKISCQLQRRQVPESAHLYDPWNCGDEYEKNASSQPFLLRSLEPEFHMV